MSLSDIMSHENLSLLPQAALVIFLLVFAAVAVRTFWRRAGDEHEEAARMPLTDDAPSFSRD